MKSCRYASGSLIALALLLGGCGGGAKPAEQPASEPAASSETGGAEKSDAEKSDADKSDSDKADSSDKAGGAKSDAGKSATKSATKSTPADDGPKPTRSATDILTAPDVVFLFSFNDSEPKHAAEEKCNKKAGNDPKKLNTCMAGERQNFPADGHRFKQDEKGQWWWITVRQKGNRLVALHKIPVELGEETPTSVTLKPVGKDKGTAPINPPAKIVFEVPNDYQIALQDPKAGRLVFQAKIGVVTE
jgi:hypothetical protein